MSETGGYITLSSRIAYENRWLRLREDIIRRPDGSPGLYGVVERDDFVVIVALDNGEPGAGEPGITLVEQFRYPVGRRLWELPMGMWEERPDATPEAIAAGELREETGLQAGRMERISTLFQGPGYSNQKGHLFLATVLSRGTAQRETSEQDMVSRRFPLREIEAMIGDGRITCMVTIAAIGLLRIKGLL
ncbi:MAG: NUDIX hydrolase [Gluconacetobacter diazotrophicus]|nr:NUDIX hydrolase [Gluconacetobacter diazotrophicus]